jgi:hypothetical protein
VSIKGELGKRTWGILAAGLMCLLGLSQWSQAAGRMSGARVVIVAGQGSEWINGELIGVRSDAVVIGTEAGETRTVAIADISSVRIIRKAAWLGGAVVGGLIGGGAGIALRPKVKDETNPFEVLLSPIGALASIGAGIVVGGLAGGIAGSALGKDKVYDLKTMSAAEVGNFMSKLRKMARVKNYK